MAGAPVVRCVERQQLCHGLVAGDVPQLPRRPSRHHEAAAVSELEVKAREVEAALVVHAFWSNTEHPRFVTTWCKTQAFSSRAFSPRAATTGDHSRVTCAACRQALINAGLLSGKRWA